MTGYYWVCGRCDRKNYDLTGSCACPYWARRNHTEIGTVLTRPARAPRKPAPFHVSKHGDTWVLAKSGWGDGIDGFETAAEAIDYAYQNWPWWP